MRYLLLIIPMLLIGQPPMEHAEPMREPEIPFEELSTEEREKVEDLFHDTQVELIKLRSEIKIKELDLRKLIKSDKPNMGKIRSLVNQIADLHAKVKIAQIERQLKVRDIVGPEKWEKLEHRKAKFMRKRILKHKLHR